MAFTAHDIVSDSPTNNFATLNSVDKYSTTATQEGNLKWNATTGAVSVSATIALPSEGKWYWEVYCVSNVSNGVIGVTEYSTVIGDNLVGPAIGTSGWKGNADAIIQDIPAQPAVAYTNSDILAVLYDVDGGNITFYKNGTQVFTDTHTHSNPKPALGNASSTTAVNFIANFGQDPTFAGNKSPTTTYTDANGIGAFYYQPPTDALALCTANLPEMTPTVTGDVPQEYFKTVLWTGKTAGQDMISYDTTRTSIHGTNPSNIGTVYVGWKPDLVWLKIKGGDTGPHNLYDSLRVDSNNLHPILFSNNSNQENTNNNGFEGFVSNGFELNENGGGGDINGATSRTYVGWCFSAGGSPSATDDGTGVSGSAKLVDTSGAASSTTCKAFKDAAVTAGASNVICPSKMSINQAAGFSIVKYTGTGSNATVPHGLSSAPEVIIVKNLDDTGGRNWIVYHHKASSTPHKDFLYLDKPDDAAAQPLYWNNTYPTSSVFSLGSASAVNRSDDAHIAYCWHSVEGYSKIGSYTSNGSADGPFIYCGFRPAFVMIKCSSNTNTTYTSWAMYDNARDSSNVMNKVLYANKSINEGYRGDGSTARTDIYIDFISNGFKIRVAIGEINATTEQTFIFMAFAEQPFKFSNAR